MIIEEEITETAEIRYRSKENGMKKRRGILLF
jgi:hypothetical protein